MSIVYATKIIDKHEISWKWCAIGKIYAKIFNPDSVATDYME